MLFIYNIFHIIILLFFWPFISAFILFKSKYRTRVPKRLGFGLKKRLDPISHHNKVIWIHALSVGEVTSALPLILGIRSEYENVQIVFSATTLTGSKLAKEKISRYVDCVVPFPLDLFPVTKYFLNRIQPDLFILVETDFWPNILAQLRSRKIPSLLVNGRISNKSIHSYKKYSYFFKPLFHSFAHLCMQTEADKEKMLSLGLVSDKLHTLGNLKFDTVLPEGALIDKDNHILPDNSLIFIAGSTHEGEEEHILETVVKLRKEYNIFFVIAPRNIKRTPSLIQTVQAYGLTVSKRSDGLSTFRDVLILDTHGELFSFYRNADIAFVGGSLVPQGGHNPIEPAIFGVPVIFGPHMDDFSEISKDLVTAGGAFEVKIHTSLHDTLRQLLADEEFRYVSGKAASSYVIKKQGVIRRHIKLIRKLL
ncbi:MAG: 3-deoxy-D-manno-octulosonic acid transferase [Bacteroidetes bacterium]|nr:3-deoxy-D-manno-octulosonic acid transferase [Bacteroidota bacterium]